MSNTTTIAIGSTVINLPSSRRRRATCIAGPSVMDVIAAHQHGYQMLTEADVLLVTAHRAFVSSFETRPLELPATGLTFARLRQGGAEAEIERRSAKDKFGLYSFPGPLRQGEADRLRRVEAGIREREAEFDLEALAADLDLAAKVEDIARSAFLRFPVHTLGDARAKVAHAREMWADGDLEPEDFETFLASFVMRP